MTCVGCGFELSAGFAFCPQCGRPQALVCAACGFSCQPGFAFCPQCGNSLAAGANGKAGGRRSAVPAGPGREADRRQVTVLFADVSGFTTLAERLDPEEVRSFQGALFETCERVIGRYGGFIAKFLGDGVLALFGAPVAHEDDPQRALNAALELLADAAALDRHWERRLGQPVALHIAVHTGPVVAGSIGGDAGAGYDVSGDTVNTAARLLGAAAPGTVLVSEATAALARHRFAFDAAGEVSLRGKAGKIVVHRLSGALAEPGSARGLAAFGLVSPMIGRTEELDRLHAAFARMQRGRAQVVCLIGEAGTGKSRLIAEFLAQLEAAGELGRIALRRAACSSLGEPPYGAFAALFREGYEVAPDDSLDVARAKLAQGLDKLGARAEVADAIMPVLSYLLGVEEARPRELDPEQLKRQIVLAARMLVERRLAQGPVLVVVEDLHWADTASTELLRDIADHLSERQLMLIASHRPEAPPPLMARAAQTIIRLSPLSPDETQAMVSGLFGPVDETAFAPVRGLVARQAGGNPLFVEEIVRMLVSTGALARHGERWTCTGDCHAANVPPTLHGLLLSRIDRLPPDSRRLLQAAAVLGISFDDQLLRAVANGGHDDGAAFDRLVEAELIQEIGRGREGGRFRFTHALVHEVVYENLLLARRGELHDRAARAIEHVFGESPVRLGDLEALGYHWSLGSDKPKGARFLVAAGDRARAVYANDDAIRHYRRALQTLEGCPGANAEIAAVNERLGDLLALTGGRSDALGHYEAVQRSLEAAGERSGGARLQRKIGRLHWEAGDRERARDCFSAGLALLGDDGSPVERAQLYQEVGRLAFRAGDNARAVEWAERALAEAVDDDRPGEPERAREIAAMQAQAHNTLGVALARMGRVAEAVAGIERSIELAERHDLLQAACRGYTNLGVLYSSLDPRRSIATCLRGLETAKKVGDLGFQSHLYANLAVAYCTLTDRCEVEGLEAAKIAIDLDRRLGLLDHLAVPLIVLGQIAQCHGNHALALTSYEEALSLAEQTGEPQLLFPCYDGLATLNLDAGNVAMAEAYLTKSQEVCERAGVEPDALLVLPFLC